RVAHGCQMLDEAAGIGAETDLTRDGDAEAVCLLAEEVGVVAARRALLPEHADLPVALARQPLGAHHTLGRDVAVGNGEAVVAGEAPRAGPPDRRAPALVDQRLQLQAVVGDHGAQHDDTALVDEPLVALATLQIVLALP